MRTIPHQCSNNNSAPSQQSRSFKIDSRQIVMSQIHRMVATQASHKTKAWRELVVIFQLVTRNLSKVNVSQKFPDVAPSQIYRSRKS